MSQRSGIASSQPPSVDEASTRKVELVAALATAIGIGLIVFMVTWIIGARVTTRFWGPPAGAVVAMGLALLVGLLVTIRSGLRLVRSIA